MIRTVRRALKRWSARALAFLLGGNTTRPLATPPKRILVLRIDERVGNVLLTTPLFRALRVHFPDARIDALLAASKVDLVDDSIHVIPFEKRDAFRRPWSFVRLLWSLRRAYDVAIDASHWHHFSVSSAVLLGWTAAGHRIAHDRGDAARFATLAIAAPTQPETEIRTKLRLAEPLGVKNAPATMSTALGRSGNAADRMERWLAEHAPDSRYVGLSVGARKADHRVAPEVFERLAAVTIACGATPIVLWGPGEESLADSIAQNTNALVAPPTDLHELAALMRRMTVVVANDTGPMHLAVACQAPTIALFLRADPDRWGHHDPPHAVIPCDGLSAAEIVDAATPVVKARLASD